MAGDDVSIQRPQSVSIGSNDTAICIIPPTQSWPSIDNLRSLYDKAYLKWPPHINLVYPFVGAEDLWLASELVVSQLCSSAGAGELGIMRIRLNAADAFIHRHDNTIFLHDNDEDRTLRLNDLRKLILNALRALDTAKKPYRMHLSIGQSQDHNAAPHKFLLEKASLLPEVKWTVEKLYIMVRERATLGGDAFNQMKVWGFIDLNTLTLHKMEHPASLYAADRAAVPFLENLTMPEASETSTRHPYTFSPEKGRWIIRQVSKDHSKSKIDHVRGMSVASYNVLAEFEWPSSKGRYPLILEAILSQPTLADVLVLQEVTDSFLSFICADDTIRESYGFITHGPPAQADIEPLPSHLNTVVNPWILAGDFNVTTSSFTIAAALKKKAISSQTVTCLKKLDTILSEAGLVDSWSAARVQYGDRSDLEYGIESQEEESLEGEQGATFNPLVNSLAAEVVGSGMNNRPQRYDRILVKGERAFEIVGFTLFGRRQGCLHGDGTSSSVDDDVEARTNRKLSYPSDHWGVKCFLKFKNPDDKQSSEDVKKLIVPVHLTSAPDSLASVAELKNCIDDQDILPSSADLSRAKEAFELLKCVVLDEENVAQRGDSTFVVVPVGSYGLGVWTTSSDIDCLCIGPISSRTFFALAAQRLRRAASRGVKILRRVNANSGTMLELEVLDIKMDLQYCPSSLIAETWPNAMKLPANDSVFALPTQTLAKLKPVRDMFYTRHTVPDYAVFRTAYHVIKLWAKRRGLYSAKFGLLGGIHISILLSRVCKMLSQNGESVPLPSILTTFFRHYASFNWASDLVFDPFFHRNLRYVRTAREPLAILGFHPPSLNTAHNASLPSVRTISEEFKRADALLSAKGTSWTGFLDSSQGPSDFLTTFKSFVKIDVQFWGVSLAKGSGFVGWLESRCVMLLVDLNRRVPSLHARIWPARFVDESASDEDNDYQGCYLIGLDKWEKEGEAMTKDGMKAALGSLHASLQKFEGQIRGDEKYFDGNTSWMSATLVNQSDLGTLRLDNREWGDYTVGDDESDEEEEEEEEEEAESPGSHEGGEGTSSRGAKKSKSKKNMATTNLPSRPAYKGKFRASADVINRLRWDPSMNSSDYIVGYEDRFLGTKERPLDQWKSEQTDEEFIPQHRILYFKRASDGVVVWDRKERKDTVFGSGVSSLDAVSGGQGH